MTRRELLTMAGASGLAAACTPSFARTLSAAGPERGAGGPARIETEIVRILLRHTWTTTMSSSDHRDTLHVRYTRDGITGIGEGAPIVRYKENAVDAKQAVDGHGDWLTGLDPLAWDALVTALVGRVEGQWAAKAAVDIAVMDWVGKRHGVPVYHLFGLDPANAPMTTFSIGIDTPEITQQKVREAEAYPLLKIKVGLDTDEATIAAVRSVTDKTLRVDANEGWTDKEVAVRKIEWLVSQGVDLVEQPLPAAMLEETRWIRDRVDVPIIADEACGRPEDVPKLAEFYDGVNIKLDKAGGIVQAHRALQVARALGMRTMLGCMVSSSVSVTAAAHLSPMVDFADLDGNLLISNDPYRGVLVKEGRLVLPTGPGLGLTPARS